MKTLLTPKVTLLTMLALLMLAMSQATFAAEPRVRDGGAFFSPGTVAEVESQLEVLNQSSKRNVIVETFATAPEELRGKLDSTNAGSAAPILGTFASDRAKKLGADAYVFVTRTPSHLRVVSREMNPADRDRIGTAMVTAFKEKQFDQGLRTATSSLAESLASVKAGAADGPRPLPGWGSTGSHDARAADPGNAHGDTVPAPVAKPVQGMSWMTIILFAVGAFILFKIVGAIFGGRRQAQNGMGPGGQNLNQPQQGIGQQGYGQNPGGGGFGRGMAGGVLGGLLGGYLGNQVFGQSHQDHGSSDPASGSDSSAHDQDSNSDFSSGGDFGGDSGGGDSSGGDF